MDRRKKKTTSKTIGIHNKSSKGIPEVAKQENYGIYFKHDGCTMLLFCGLSFTNAMIRRDALERIYNDWCGKFIISKSKKR